jgi:glycosyltransferase involved in cell wall biosynthesis
LTFSIIIPVHNEEAGIGRTARSLLSGLPADAELVFACNGCTDGSWREIRNVLGDRAKILNVPAPGKASALRAAEQQVKSFPRFYIDADVEISGSDVAALKALLDRGEADLVSPMIEYDLAGCSWAARAIHRTALALPHLRSGAFHAVLGLSSDGRSRWGEFPDVLADDAFVEAQIPPSRKMIVPDVRVVVRPPRTFWSVVRVRERWDRGHAELRTLQIERSRVAGQRRAILAKASGAASLMELCVYVAARMLARALAALPLRRRYRWYRDSSSRVQLRKTH